MNNIQETDVLDSEGTVIISPGLKVRHKDSQYEYTVEDVVQNPEKEIEIILRLPEEPRFEPEPESNSVLQAKSKKQSGIIYEYEVSSDLAVYYRPDEDEPEDSDLDMISVGQKEFEDEYEVK